MLTARDTVGDRVTGLDAGADDYLVKPFAYEELAARLRALGRARQRARRPEPKLVVGPITLDETSRGSPSTARRIDLSPREFSLLECLLRHPGQTLSRDQLLDQAWPFSVAVTPERRRRLHPLPARQARRGRATDRDRPWRRAIVWPMPDGVITPTEATAPERAADAADAGCSAASAATSCCGAA